MFEFQIAKKLYSHKSGERKISRPAVLVAILGIAIGFIVMLITIAVVIGFKAEIRNKVVGFNSEIQILNYNTAAAHESHPIAVSDSLMKHLKSYPEITKIERFSVRPGLVKTDDDFQGMILKGVGQEYDMSFFEKYLVEGRLPQFSDSVSSNDILLSKTLADALGLKLDDRIYTYFTESEGIKARRLNIVGIYQTNFYAFDQLYLITDLHLVNRLNKWSPDQFSGLELSIRDYSTLEEFTESLGSFLYDKNDPYGEPYYVGNVEQQNPQLFGWLALLDLNVWVILGLMMAISGFTIISGLLILILERTQMIGLFKGLGATNGSIRKIFIWLSLFLIGKGLLWGNVIGLGLCFLQKTFGIVSLDPVIYHVSEVPVSVSLWWVFLLNISVITIAILMLVGPSYLVSRIKPATSIRYE